MIQNAVTNITAVIKAKDEERQIVEAVESALRLASRVLVIDDNSADATATLAWAAGAEVIPAIAHHGQIDLLDKQGFMLVEDGWIVRMDADERLTDELIGELRRIVHSGVSASAEYARLNHMFGAAVRHGGWFLPHQRGFFRADSWSRDWDAHMHTQVPVTGLIETIAPSRAWMIHLDYDDIATFVRRSLSGYAAVEAREMFESGVKFRLGGLLVEPWKRTFGRYFIRQGYRDGLRGLVLAGLLGAYDIAKWSFLWELEKNEKGPKA